ncbi:MAG: TolC family protein, partial [Cyclobacteriaceae bacterium]
LSAQQDTVQLSLTEIMELTIANNSALKASELEVARRQELVRSGYSWDKTNVYYSYDENNIAENGEAIGVWGIRQSFAFPTVYNASKQSLLAEVNRQQLQFELNTYKLRKQVSKLFFQTAYLKALGERYEYLDSLYSNFAYAARRRFETGESNYLEQVTAEAKMKETQLTLIKNRQELAASYASLQAIIQSDSIITIPDNAFEKISITMDRTIEDHPGILLWDSFEEMADWKTRTEKNKLLPDIQLSYFQGSNNIPDARIYRGFEVGLALPIFYGTQKGNIRAGKIEQTIYARQGENYRKQLEAERTILLGQLDQALEALSYYENSGRNLITEIVRASQRSFQEGEINYFQYIQSLDNALNMEISYLESLLRYNLTVIDLQYLTLEP